MIAYIPEVDLAQFYNLTHQFIKKEIKGNVEQWERSSTYPIELHQQAAQYQLIKFSYNRLIYNKQFDYVAMLCEQICMNSSQAIAVALTSMFPVLSILYKYRKNAYCQEVIDKALSGKAIISLAVTEPQAGSDINLVKTELCVNNDYIALNGTKSLICNVQNATHLLLLTKQSNKLALVLCEKPSNMNIERVDTIGWKSLPINNVQFTNSTARAFCLLNTGNNCKASLYQCFTYERLNMAVLAYSSAKLAFNQTTIYARSRTSFGKPLIKHQAIKHKLAEIKTELDAMSHMLTNTLAKDISDANNVAACKLFCTQRAQFIIDQALQIFAGQACIAGHVIERLYRDTRILRIGGGTDEMMKEIIGGAML